MEITFQPAKTGAHFEQIIQLQKQNLYSILDDAQKDEQGFVFVQHTVELLKEMAAYLPQMIAFNNNKVVGYNLALSPLMRGKVPELDDMFVAIDKATYRGRPVIDYNFAIGGQVCVDAHFRGAGLLSRLYNSTKTELGEGFDLIVTEVATRNGRSLRAHQKMGFEIIQTYKEGEEEWNVVVWDLKKTNN